MTKKLKNNFKIKCKNKISASADFFLRNTMAALAASFVIMSLGAAFGMMSGRGALIGIISSALIPIITAYISGSKIQCSGPTGPVTVISAGIIGLASENFSNPVIQNSFINFVLILSALIVTLFGVFRLGRFISLIPRVVISGFMTGIALIITQSQLGVLSEYWLESPNNMIPKLGIVIVATICMFMFPLLVKKFLPPKAQFVSGTLLTIIFVTILAQTLQVNIPTVNLKIDQNFSSISNFIQPFWSAEFMNIQTLWTALFWAIQLAFIMSLDTLMTSVVMDKMTGHKTKRNQELFCQSTSTTIMGLIGGIPGAQATVRSVLIFKEGATGRLASFLLGIFILVELVFFRDWIELIPEAVFIGVVLKIAYDIADWKPLKLYWEQLFTDQSPLKKNFMSRHDEEKIYVTNRELFFILGTALLTLLTNLIIAVFVFTLLYHVGNKYIWIHNPVRDLKPLTETEGFKDED